jgi:hypothetical protein
MLHLLSEHEAAILDAAAHVRFGELTNVEIVSGLFDVPRSISAAQIAFVKTLRDEGLSRLDAIVVHNGIPSQIEVDGEHGSLKIKYRRKIRFSN